MKIRLYIILTFLPLLSIGQEYPIVDTLNYGSNVSHVKYYIQNEGEDEVLIKTYWFNELGKHTTTYTGYGGFKIYKQSKITYNYSINGNLDNIKHQDYISPQNDSIGNFITTEIKKVISNGSYKKGNNVIENILAKYESSYISVVPEDINWHSSENLHPAMIFKRNQLGQDSLILLFDTISKNEMCLDEIVSFIYDDENRLVKKKWINMPIRYGFEFQVFKPSSVNFEDSTLNLNNIYQEKIYKYLEDTIEIKYFEEKHLTGTEIKVLNDKNLVQSELVINARQDTLSHYQYKWNSMNKLESSKRIKHTGYDGFGWALDLTYGNIKKYKYDDKNRLVRIEIFQDDKLVCTERYEIIERK
ncbi:hypothetical protein [Marinifilum sp. D737]|uniref:hypothetical protein n=1 Tax=Marinifilum sp. D737 TaxID=2969628 RepID=UPI0022754797|nr:hypothetical protein [Marinifilum sp. D737]MCY1634032.1 hypothetical protein [Marinifilum sp. D737]